MDNLIKCDLYKHKKVVATHWVDCNGNIYPKKEYCNHGFGGIYRGFRDLPKEGYPYSILYKTVGVFKCCEVCSCDKSEL